MKQKDQEKNTLMKLKIVIKNKREKTKKMHQISTGLDKINCLAQQISRHYIKFILSNSVNIWQLSSSVDI